MEIISMLPHLFCGWFQTVTFSFVYLLQGRKVRFLNLFLGGQDDVWRVSFISKKLNIQFMEVLEHQFVPCHMGQHLSMLQPKGWSQVAWYNLQVAEAGGTVLRGVPLWKVLRNFRSPSKTLWLWLLHYSQKEHNFSLHIEGAKHTYSKGHTFLLAHSLSQNWEPSSHTSTPVFSDIGRPIFGCSLSDTLSRNREGNSSLELDLTLLHDWKPGISWFSANPCGIQGIESLTPGTQISPFVSLSNQCSRNCSGGFQIREIQCVDSRDHQSLRPFHCQFLAGIPPPLSRSCNVEPCEEWQVEPWSQVWPPDTSSSQLGRCKLMCYLVSLEVSEDHMCIMTMTGLHSGAHHCKEEA